MQHTDWPRLLRTGLVHHQQRITKINEKTRLFWAFETTFVPELVQTAKYARHRFAQSVAVFKVRNDIDEAAAARVKRQDILCRSDKKFHFVITEAALRYRLCSPTIMLGQLDRLVSLSALPNVKLGVIGFQTTYFVAPSHGFWLFDDTSSDGGDFFC